MSLPKFTEEMREKMLADLEAGRCQLCGQIRPDRVPKQEPVGLLPCPFCGGKGVFAGLDRSVIRCVECLADGPRMKSGADADALAAWNRRSAPPPEQEPVELRELLESFRYQSSSGRGERGLMKHHIDALVKYLAPYFRSTPPPEQLSKVQPASGDLAAPIRGDSPDGGTVPQASDAGSLWADWMERHMRFDGLKLTRPDAEALVTVLRPPPEQPAASEGEARRDGSRWTWRWRYAGPGRGDCSNYVGLPEVEDETTTDEYGIPHGWCDYCWASEQLRRARAPSAAEGEELEALVYLERVALDGRGLSEVDAEEIRETAATIRAALTKSAPGSCCDICGGRMVFIRGRFPKMDDREVCPTCLAERMDQIRDVSSPDYGQAYQPSAPQEKGR